MSVELSAIEIAGAVHRRERSAVEVVEEHLRRIESANREIGAFCEVLGDEALEEARRIDGGRARAARGAPLLGAPLAVKDNIETEAGHTTYGSRVFAGNRPGFDAEVVRRLRRAGCVVIGKTNTPEFGMSHHTENAAYGRTGTPWDPTRTAGGSSGGSAAAVAAGMAPLALGNDTGGSVRLPASCCGVLGIKPSRGRMSWAPALRDPWGGIGSHGPMAATVADLAKAFDVLSGWSPLDPYAARPLRVSATTAIGRPVGRLRVAVTADGSDAGEVDAEVREAVHRVAGKLEELGHAVEEGAPDLTGLQHPLTVLDAAWAQEAWPADKSSAVEPYTRAYARLGAAWSAPELARALDSMNRRAMEIVRFWDDRDLLLTPTMSVVPPRGGHPEDVEARGREFDAWCQFLYPFNISGQPALSVPAGLSREGVPIGVQLVGPPGRDDMLFQVAAALELSGIWDPAGWSKAHWQYH
jgi:amidase